MTKLIRTLGRFMPSITANSLFDASESFSNPAQH